MIERVVLHEAIIEEIKKYIKQNKLKPGDRLPNQNEFTEMLGVSRTSLREALRTLQAVGMIEIKNGKGTFLKNKDEYKIETILNVEDTRKFLLYIHEVRRAIEGVAVKLAAERASEDDIKIMELNIKLILEKAERGESQPDEDKAFHNAIYSAAKNPVLTDITDHLHKIMYVLWQNPLGMGEALNKDAKLHYQVFKHIKNHDVVNAEKAFCKLMDNIEIIMRSI